MALDENAMAALVKANIEAISNYPQPGSSPAFVTDAVIKAICKGIVDHIKSSAVVTASGPDPQGGTQNVTGTVS